MHPFYWSTSVNWRGFEQQVVVSFTFDERAFPACLQSCKSCFSTGLAWEDHPPTNPPTSPPANPPTHPPAHPPTDKTARLEVLLYLGRCHHLRNHQGLASRRNVQHFSPPHRLVPLVAKCQGKTVLEDSVCLGFVVCEDAAGLCPMNI